MSRVFEAYQEELWATLQMPFEDYQRLKIDEQYQEIKLLSVKDKSMNYKEDELWTELNERMVEAIKERTIREEEIRSIKLSNNERRNN